MFVDVKPESGDPGTGFADPMESDPVATNGGSGMDDENFEDNNRSVTCTPEQLSLLSQRLALKWKILAPELGFDPDEVSILRIPSRKVCSHLFYIYTCKILCVCSPTSDFDANLIDTTLIYKSVFGCAF